MTTALGEMIRNSITYHNIGVLVSLPEWKFCMAFADGLYNEPCAGTTFEGVYYSEREIYIAYLTRNPGADPLV